MKTFVDNHGNMRIDIGDNSDPKYQSPLVNDLIRKTWTDLMKAMDRNMDLAGVASEEDRELEVFLKNSLMVTTSTSLMGQCISFLIYTHSNGHIEADDLPPKDYAERVAKHLSMVGEIMMKGHKIDHDKKLKAHASKLTGC